MGWLSNLRGWLFREKAPQFIPTGPPDPEFLGDFLVYQFLDNNFGLTEEQFQQFAAELSEELKDLTKLWTLFYLSWIFKMYAASKYGQGFSDQLVAQVVERFQKEESLGVEGLGSAFDFWLDRLDDSTSQIGTEVEGVEVPFEVFAAMVFLALDESSPYYKSERTDGVEFEVATAFASAKDAALQFIQSSVDLGRPVEEIISNRWAPIAPGVKMDELFELMLNNPDKIHESLRKESEIIRDKFDPTYLDNIRKEFLELEEESLKAENPLVPLRKSIMTFLDISIICEEMANIKEEELRNKVYEKLIDIMHIEYLKGQPTTEHLLAAEVIINNFGVNLVRYYSSFKYSDSSENDWLAGYQEASRATFRYLVEGLKKQITEGEIPEFEGAGLVLLNNYYKRIKKDVLKIPIQTSLYDFDTEVILKALQGMLDSESAENDD